MLVKKYQKFITKMEEEAKKHPKAREMKQYF